jgi:hypothetical protein
MHKGSNGPLERLTTLRRVPIDELESWYRNVGLPEWIVGYPELGPVRAAFEEAWQDNSR